ncbi:probable serine/threonine-protein kinase At1g01540 isoform X2 [Prosopis cineraria]|uniref:probable serine/threonine-protein kinase At1g01540 isoform X2 n=1 Tax=Prosopis cineraria TaxID=364024 RepID=UPI00240EDAD4|nr:probable serine/threonine-protein kinase At1g01540 isoform X2 [Prosopis cineraria]
MLVYDAAFLDKELSKRTSIFGLPLWVVVGIIVGAVIVLALFLLSLCLTSRRQRRCHNPKKIHDPEDAGTPVVSKEIQEIVHLPGPNQHHPTPPPEIHVDIGKSQHRVVVFSDRISSGESRGTAMSASETTSSFGGGSVGPEVSHLGWGRWYTLREVEAATNGLCEENVVGEGGYGIVYKGVLDDGTRVAVKNLLNNKMLVYEYVGNGNLEQWLHGDVGSVSPLTWDIRMNIILGTAKGLAYLHEGLEPKVVHRDVKSSNILLDRQWNPKVSDFGLAKLLCSEHSYVTTRVMGTFGYVAPEYACTGMLTEKSDIYSFGILIMEIITGRSPVDYGRPQGEVNLIDWLKAMVGNRKSEQLVDPKLPEIPSSKALKRALLVALRCVDPDATKRPQMGHVIHMLEADDLLFPDPQERRIRGEPSHSNRDRQEQKELNLDKRSNGEGITGPSEADDSSRSHHQPTRWR